MEVLMKFKSLGLVSLLTVSAAHADLADYAKYRKTVKKVEAMTSNPANTKLASEYGLSLVNVAWEDTGRGKNSSTGPNISDLTIQAHTVNDNGEVTPVSMPVLRYPNFDDISADISADKFFVPVGNEKGQPLKQVSLTEYLENLTDYLTDSTSWATEKVSTDENGKETKTKIDRQLLAARDAHVLVSAQVAFLPVPLKGKAEFNPVIFNYQSAENSPAVLTILATREGTSATIIDNTRDSFEAPRSFRTGQRLFFNENGQRASLTAVRQQEFLAELGNAKVGSLVSSNHESGLNMVLLIQVPLKHKNQGFLSDFALEGMFFSMAASPNVDDAVIGHGKIEGPFTEIDNQAIERDERFPIRVTVQFYKATDSEVLTKEMVEESKRTIQKVYKQADYVGSLVTGGKTLRPTDHDVKWCEDRPWWPIYFANNPMIALEGDQAPSVSGKQNMVELLQKRYPRGRFWKYICGGPIYFQNAVKFALESESN
jgi:hypothetical protein